MKIRRGTTEDIELLVQNRIDFLNIVGNHEIAFTEGFRDRIYEFMKTNLEDGSLSVWIAEECGEIISAAMVCYYSLLPSIHNSTGKTGYIQNVYTVSEHRGKGLASELVNRIIQEAKERNTGVLYLHATDMGKPVYERLGFENKSGNMVYNLD